MDGHCTVLPSQAYDIKTALKIIEKEKCTFTCGTPTMYIDMINHPDFHKTDVSTLSRGYIGGSTCSPELLRSLIERLDCFGLVNAYGSTEVASACFARGPSESIEDKIKSIGRVYDFMEAKIINSEGRIVPVNTPGEICVRGYKVFLGYWEDEEKTRETIKNGWYHTGDIGVLDEDGNLSVVDRIKDMIIRGGENIYPMEIESFLLTNPKIADAQVIGVPDERMGEELCVWICLKADQTMTESELRDFCKNQLSYFKIPRYIMFVKLEDFPRTASGKVRKESMRQQMAKSMKESESVL